MSAHLGADDVARYLDGGLPLAQRAQLEHHLADCDECRAELIALERVLRTRPGTRRWYVPVAAAAAAAVFLLLIMPRHQQPPPTYREPAVSATVAPTPITPRGTVTTPIRLVWTRVPHATRYRLTVFDSTGSVIWEDQTTDTSVALPGTVGLRPRLRYFWQVEAQTSWHRWAKSDVVEFSRP